MPDGIAQIARLIARRTQAQTEREFPQRGGVAGQIPVAVADLAAVESVRAQGIIGIPRDCRGVPEIETNPELAPYLARGYRDDPGVYEQMRRTDGTIDGMLSLVERELSRVPYHVVEPPDPTPEERRAADLTRAYLGIDGYTGWIKGGWRAHLKLALRSLQFGFAPFERLWTARNWQGQVIQVPTRLEWRQPRSVWGWLWRRDDLRAMLQTQPDDLGGQSIRGDSLTVARRNTLSLLGSRVIPISTQRLLLYTYGATSGNPEGVSAIRPNWVWWRCKRDTIARNQAAQELLSNPLLLLEEQQLEAGAREASSTDLLTFARYWDGYAAGEFDWLYVPRSYKASMKTPGSDLSSPVDFLAYCDEQMRLTFAAQMLSLGASSSGTAGLSGAFGQLLYNALQSISMDVCDVFNGMPDTPWTGAVRDVVDANIVHGPDFRYPRVEALGLQHQDAKAFADGLAKLLQFKAIRYTAESEAKARQVMGLPPLTREEFEARQALDDAMIDGEIAAARTMGAGAPGEDTSQIEQADQERASEEGTQAPVMAPEQTTDTDPDGF